MSAELSIGSIYESEVEELLRKRIEVKTEIERLIFNKHIGKSMKKMFLKLAGDAGIKNDFVIKSENILLKNKQFFFPIAHSKMRMMCSLGGNMEYIVCQMKNDGRTILTFEEKAKNDKNHMMYGYYCAVLEKAKLYMKENVKIWEGIYVKLSLSASPYIVGREI